MNLTTEMGEDHKVVQEKPGKQLALLRESMGYSQEYVAAKLHLRVRVIELLEADDYIQLPEQVFISGYLRAYAKLLEIPADPLLKIFNNLYQPVKKADKALWQGKRESHIAEKFIRLLTAFMVISIIVAGGFWWQKNKDNQPVFAQKNTETLTVLEDTNLSKNNLEIKLTDISKMQSILKPLSTETTPLRSTDG